LRTHAPQKHRKVEHGIDPRPQKKRKVEVAPSNRRTLSLVRCSLSTPPPN
jgi:hypothetical protein